MPKHITIVCVLTFVLGFCTGVFIFAQTRDPEVQRTASSQDEPRRGYEILAYTYGGCERVGCASYRILDDGSYTYIIRSTQGGDARYEDAISPKRSEDLKATLDDANLGKLKETTYTGTCPASFDGVAYRYEVRRGGEEYSFDSCVEALDSEPLFDLLVDYFEIFSVTHARS